MEISITKTVLLTVLLGTLMSYSIPCAAQDLLSESTAPVAAHEKKTSSVSFPANMYIARKARTSDEEPGNDLATSTSYVLFTPKDTIEDPALKKALVYTLPPHCVDSKVKMDEVFHDTAGSEKLDILVYNASNQDHLEQIKKYQNVSVPWDPSYDPSEGQETKDARFQDLIRVLDPECLPARFKFVYVGAKRYNEIRYGSKAFE